jgi:hypothetical protein
MSANFQPSTRSTWLRAGARLLALVALALLAALLTAPPARAQSPGYSQVSAGFRNTCALRTDGNVECWGTNLFGESKTSPAPSCRSRQTPNTPARSRAPSTLVKAL